MAADTRTAARQASPVLSGPAAKSMPMAIPWEGRNPANQYTESPCDTRVMITISMTVTATAVAIPIASRIRRLGLRNRLAADIPAATSSGTTVARGSSWSTG
jgi:hypothetical protein